MVYIWVLVYKCFGYKISNVYFIGFNKLWMRFFGRLVGVLNVKGKENFYDCKLFLFV